MADFKIDFSRLLPKQKDYWRLPNQIRLLTGGKRAGKTYLGALRSLYLSAMNPGKEGMCVSPTFPIARKTTIRQLRLFLRKGGIRYDFNKSDHLFYIPGWDGTIHIGSGNNPDSLVGATLAWGWIDEPFLQDRAVFDEMLARISDETATIMELMLTGTPEELNWGYDLATGLIPGLDIGIVYASTLDNPHVPASTIAAMQASYTEEMQKAYLGGKFVLLTKGRVYQPFNREKHVTDRGALSSLPIVIGIDFNVDYLTAEIGRLGPNWIHWFDEIRLSNATTYDLADKLHQRYPSGICYPDPSGSHRSTSSLHSDHHILRNKGFEVRTRAGQPPIRNRVNAMNRMLLQDRMTFDPRCVWLIKDMERNIWKSGTVDKSIMDLTHGADAAGYPVDLIFPLSGGEFFMGVR